MHIPSHFKEENPQRLQQIIHDYGFGMLITGGALGPEVQHLPFLFKTGEAGEPTLLQCHVARANGVWKTISEQNQVLAVFQGPQCYISPSWYPSKQKNGRAVPTWNYVAVHARGPARVVDDESWLREHLQGLSSQHEAGQEQPWQLDDAPKDYTQKLLRALVGIEISVQFLQGQFKASQNQPEENRSAVKSRLANADGEQQRAMAALINA